MKNSVKYIITAILLVISIALGIFVYTYWFKEFDPTQDEEFNSVQKVAFEKELYKSDFDDIYYSMSPAAFYQKVDDKFVEYPCINTTISMELFSVAISFDFHYININGQYFGFGEYENGNTYYYIKGMNPPISSSYNKPHLMILLFDDNKNIPDYQRLYSECHIYDTNKNIVTNQYVQDRNRPVTADGKKRNDYAMFTTEMLQKVTTRRTLFLTRAFYEYSTDPHRVTDINAIKWGYTHESYIYDILLNYAFDNEQGQTFYYKNNVNGGFDARLGTGAENDAVLYHFEGNAVDDYRRSGDFIVKTNSLTNDSLKGTVVNPLTQYVVDFKIEKKYKKITDVRVSNDGTKLVILGNWEYTDRRQPKTMQMITTIDLTKNSVTQYVGHKLFDKNTPLYFENDKLLYFTDNKLCYTIIK